ncbi:MAG TPA: hypothetical protein VFJ02_16390, partial [Vicinamibacterales bacterium]|nr:hypothetical protein [Vicinamibacterales bacterium]
RALRGDRRRRDAGPVDFCGDEDGGEIVVSRALTHVVASDSEQLGLLDSGTGVGRARDRTCRERLPM